RGADQAGAVSAARRVPESSAALVGLRFEAGGGPGRLHHAAVLGMNGVEPAVTGVVIPGLPGVILPGDLQIGEGAVTPGLPWNVGEQSREDAQALFAPAGFFILCLALDEIRGQARQDVEESQVLF